MAIMQGTAVAQPAGVAKPLLPPKKPTDPNAPPQPPGAPTPVNPAPATPQPSGVQPPTQTFAQMQAAGQARPPMPSGVSPAAPSSTPASPAPANPVVQTSGVGGLSGPLTQYIGGVPAIPTPANAYGAANPAGTAGSGQPGYGTQWTIDANGVVKNLVSGDKLTSPAPAGTGTAWNSATQSYQPVGSFGPAAGTPTPGAVAAQPTAAQGAAQAALVAQQAKDTQAGYAAGGMTTGGQGVAPGQSIAALEANPQAAAGMTPASTTPPTMAQQLQKYIGGPASTTGPSAAPGVNQGVPLGGATPPPAGGNPTTQSGAAAPFAITPSTTNAAGAYTAQGQPAPVTSTTSTTGDAAGYTPTQGSFAGNLQQQLQNYINNPNGFNSSAVQGTYNTLSQQIDDQTNLQSQAIQDEMAKRGLTDSTINAGRMNDLNVATKSAKEQLAENLMSQEAQSQSGAQASALGLGLGANAQNLGYATSQNQNQLMLMQILAAYGLAPQTAPTYATG